MKNESKKVKYYYTIYGVLWFVFAVELILSVTGNDTPLNWMPVGLLMVTRLLVLLVLCVGLLWIVFFVGGSILRKKIPSALVAVYIVGVSFVSVDALSEYLTDKSQNNAHKIISDFLHSANNINMADNIIFDNRPFDLDKGAKDTFIKFVQKYQAGQVEIDLLFSLPMYGIYEYSCDNDVFNKCVIKQYKGLGSKEISYRVGSGM